MYSIYVCNIFLNKLKTLRSTSSWFYFDVTLFNLNIFRNNNIFTSMYVNIYLLFTYSCITYMA